VSWATRASPTYTIEFSFKEKLSSTTWRWPRREVRTTVGLAEKASADHAIVVLLHAAANIFPLVKPLLKIRSQELAHEPSRRADASSRRRLALGWP
jgi:hypothetical protein